MSRVYRSRASATCNTRFFHKRIWAEAANVLLIRHCSSVIITVIGRENWCQLSTVLHAWVTPLNDPLDAVLQATKESWTNSTQCFFLLLPLLFWSHSLFTLHLFFHFPFHTPFCLFVWAGRSVSVGVLFAVVKTKSGKGFLQTLQRLHV